jgi:hypothetical protein
MIRTTLQRTAVVSVVAACVGCPASLEDPGRFSDAGACPDVTSDVFNKVCSTSGCHSAVDKMVGLDLQSPGVASRLLGVRATGGTGLLIDPSNPAMSVLYTKLTATPPFGVRMPFGEAPLDDATVACVLQWITDQVADAGGEDGAATEDASTADAPASEDGPGAEDAAAPPGDDASPADAAAPLDAGKALDARAPVKDASPPAGPDASVRDAATPAADAKAD